MTNPRTLADHLTIAPRFVRSVHAERDFRSAGQNGSYIVTPTTQGALRRFADGLQAGSPHRAWTLTGPYGSGKSAFAVFLSRLLCPGSTGRTSAREILRKVDPELAEKYESTGDKGYLPVVLTARRMSALPCLGEALVEAAHRARGKKLQAAVKGIESRLQSADDSETWDSRHILNGAASLAEAARSCGFDGLLFVVDELGKLFEYATRYPHRGDLFVLQELAEYAAREDDARVLFLGVLHQSFQEYGQHLDMATRREWEKIQGRFEDIPFLEPAEQVIHMIGEAIRWDSDGLPAKLKNSAAKTATAAAEAGTAPPAMDPGDFRRLAVRAYPLHPMSLVALPFLFRRFAQNERSMFSYLNSLEPFGFQEFVRNRLMNSGPVTFIRLEDLFDYFTANLGAGMYRQPHTLRWMEAADALERMDGLTPLQRSLVKTIGVLNALGEFSHLRATGDLISLAVRDTPQASSEVKQSLEALRRQSILSFRKFNSTYRIWEGSDVDLEDRVAEGERQVRRDLQLADRIREYLPARPMVARRHSFFTGALRYFTVNYLDDPTAATGELPDSRGDGTVFVCLADSPATASRFIAAAQASSSRRKGALFAIPQQIGELREIVIELGALRWAWDNTPELRDDRVARRELSSRLSDATQMVRSRLQGLLDPRPEPVGSRCVWIHSGEEQPVASPNEVAAMLSKVCDEVFDQAPRIRNELISRRQLSSAASAARRNLVEAMLTRRHEDTLGITGYPPERSMYESVLRVTGLHRKNDDGSWGFLGPPESDDPARISPSWRKLHDGVFGPTPTPVPVTTLYERLGSPPFGLPDGLHPVLLCAFLFTHVDETTLYREGTFLPDPGIADFEVLLRRPELFAVAGSRLVGGRKAVVSRMAGNLKVPPTTVSVVRDLFRRVAGLPAYSWVTQKLPPETMALREAFRNARSPEDFLFTLVPKALGMPAITEGEPDELLIESFFTSMNGQLDMWSRAELQALDTAEATLLGACGVGSGPERWEELRRRAAAIEPRVTDQRLLTFTQRIGQAGPSKEGIRAVIGLVANRPPESWSDADVERFPEAAAAIGERFREATAAVVQASLSKVEREQMNRTRQVLCEALEGLTKQPSRNAIRAALTELLKEYGD